MKKTKVAEYIFYAVVGAMLVTAITILWTVNVQSRTRADVLFDNSRYEAAEQDYKDLVNGILNSYGCQNSGLTMTRTVSLEGERTYSLQIYNRKLDLLTGEEFMQLYNELKTCGVISPDGTVYYVDVRF